MSKQQLTELLIKDEKPYQRKQQLWFNRYNHVVDVYNNSIATIESDHKHVLQKMVCENNRNLFMTYMLNNYLMNIVMVLVFTFIPLVNVGLLVAMIVYLISVKKQTQKHKRNLLKVQDPFQAFYFYPQMCIQLEKHFTTLNLTVQEIENFKFNQNHDKIRQNLVNKHEASNGPISAISQISQKKKVKVPIYDQYFYDSFFLVRKQFYKALSWSILGLFLISLDVLFYYGLLQDLLVN